MAAPVKSAPQTDAGPALPQWALFLAIAIFAALIFLGIGMCVSREETGPSSRISWSRYDQVLTCSLAPKRLPEDFKVGPNSCMDFDGDTGPVWMYEGRSYDVECVPRGQCSGNVNWPWYPNSAVPIKMMENPQFSRSITSTGPLQGVGVVGRWRLYVH